MSDAEIFAELLLLLSLSGLAAIASHGLSAKLRLPAPALFLGAAAVAVWTIPGLHTLSQHAVERIVTVALLFILFSGGLSIGQSRFRAASGSIVVVGVLGTFLTTIAVGALAHWAFGMSWYVSLLLGVAIAPTDPAVVFSVLGQREIAGRSSTILEGESGANDPVGIAMMVSLLAAGSLSTSAAVQAAGSFALEMGVGAIFGIFAGRSLIWVMRRVTLASEGLYPLRTLTFVLATFGATTLAHGSGFLAVFIVGIMLGDEKTPFKREVERFHAALASLGEIVAFVALGLTVSIGSLTQKDVWIPGLLIGAALAFIIRPIFVGLCLWPVKLNRTERIFVLFSGLKGAVPILLGSMLLGAAIPDPHRIYGIVVVVVAFSVVVQGGLIPTVAKKLRLPMRVLEPKPWSIGVRVTQEPEEMVRLTVLLGSWADGRSISELTELASSLDDYHNFLVHMLVRQGSLMSINHETGLMHGDVLLVKAEGPFRSRLQSLVEEQELSPGA